MGRDLFIFAMLSPAELKRPSKDPALTGSIPEEDDDDDLNFYANLSRPCRFPLRMADAMKCLSRMTEAGKVMCVMEGQSNDVSVIVC